MPRIDLLSVAPKAIAHLRAQLRRKRLGLIFGSGASKDLHFPDWKKLIGLIAAHPRVQGDALVARFVGKGPGGSTIRGSLASITQILFNHFRSRTIADKALQTPLTFLEEQEIRTAWLRIIHENLYAHIDLTNRSKSIKEHGYLHSFLDIVRKSPLTVNYNFDDTLEKMLLDARSGDKRNSTRGYEVTDKPNVQFQKNAGVIYHPNGFLPAIFEDGASADVVFSDDSFQDQLISAATGKYIHLSNHLFRNTCLLIGLSLEDVTLQSLLRQNAVTNPGNVHYLIDFRKEGEETTAEEYQIIFNSNFSSYNLYTLFLDNDGIRDLAALISMSKKSFALNYADAGKKFVYYLIGSIGAGKSTAASNFRNLITYDEWIDERRPEAAVPESTLTSEAVEDVNSWIAEQFRKKNFALLGQNEGIHVVDRCPLDPLTFGGAPGATQRPSKAKRLIEQITDKSCRPIEKGHVIHLDCDLADVRIRCSLKHKYWDDKEYKDLLHAIDEVYGGLERTVICTRGRNANSVAREIARVIFLDAYRPIDIGKELTKIAEGANAE